MADLTANWSSEAVEEGLIGLPSSAVEEFDEHVVAVGYVRVLGVDCLSLSVSCSVQ